MGLQQVGGGRCFCPVETGVLAVVIASSLLQRVLRIFVKRLGVGEVCV